MLLEFKGRNYKSFKDEFVFSLIPTGKKGLDYSIMENRLIEKNIKDYPLLLFMGLMHQVKPTLFLLWTLSKRLF